METVFARPCTLGSPLPLPHARGPGSAHAGHPLLAVTSACVPMGLHVRPTPCVLGTLSFGVTSQCHTAWARVSLLGARGHCRVPSRCPVRSVCMSRLSSFAACLRVCLRGTRPRAGACAAPAARAAHCPRLGRRGGRGPRGRPA